MHQATEFSAFPERVLERSQVAAGQLANVPDTAKNAGKLVREADIALARFAATHGPMRQPMRAAANISRQR